MLPADKKNTIKRYTDRYQQYGYSYKTLGWGRGGRQDIRFRVLTEIANLNGCSILDLGCGFADLYAYLKKQGWTGSYTGFDIVPILLDEARQQHPGINVHLVDILEDKVEETFDYVLSSGVFNAKLTKDNDRFTHNMITRMFSLCRKGIACDFMSSYVDYQKETAYHHRPEDIFSFAKTLTKRVTLRHDYMPFEFAIYLYREDKVGENKVRDTMKKT